MAVFDTCTVVCIHKLSDHLSSNSQKDSVYVISVRATQAAHGMENQSRCESEMTKFVSPAVGCR